MQNVECDGNCVPQVGWHGECTWGAKVDWHECVILPNSKIAYKLIVQDNWYIDKISKNHEFRPIKSEREKAIDEIHAVIDSRLDSVLDTVISGKRQIAEALYDAGLRFKD